jgi:hypothetical protein
MENHFCKFVKTLMLIIIKNKVLKRSNWMKTKNSLYQCPNKSMFKYFNINSNQIFNTKLHLEEMITLGI